MIERGWEKKVLDHGFVKLVDWMGTEEDIIASARMSTGKGFEGWAKDAKLLEFLYKNQHSTPFEMCELSLEMQLPIFVAREFVRHRVLSFNEMSARYIQMPDVHYLPEVDRVRKQSKTNKQGSEEPVDLSIANGFITKTLEEQTRIYASYETSLNLGVAKELARINTPVSRYTRWRMKGDLRGWLGFLQLRMQPAAQWEAREFANAVADVVQSLWPRTFALFLEYDLYAVKFSRSEIFAVQHWLKADLAKEDSEGYSPSFLSACDKIRGAK
jgi:thymidylate synthase (FAD)